MSAGGRDARYLIIGGSTKCATTSLFSYLATHPAVCAARMKETRYFLDPEYPVPIRRPYAPGTPYESLFDRPVDRVRLEATPDYLHSEGTAGRIRRELPAARLVFVLRHPVDRLASWYRYARQTGALGRDVPAADYVSAQLDGSAPREQHYLALEQGRYSDYLAPYFAAFDAAQLLVLRYEDLIADPGRSVRELCDFAGIAGEHFDGFDFRVHNRTGEPRFPGAVRVYRRTRAWIQKSVADKPRVHAALRALRTGAARLMPGTGRSGSPQSWLPADLAAAVSRYYAGEGARIGQVTGRTESAWWPDLDGACSDRVDARALETTSRTARGRP